jgi:hypothetical protein
LARFVLAAVNQMDLSVRPKKASGRRGPQPITFLNDIAD